MTRPHSHSAFTALRTLAAFAAIMVFVLPAYSVSGKASSQHSAEALFKKYRSAVVKIVVNQESIPVGIGAGFFVSKEGHLATNYHVIRSVILNSGFTAEFHLSDGRVIHDFDVMNCGDARGLDLCLLKLKHKPKSHFTPQKSPPSPGQSIYVIGHPQGFDFSIANGIISAVRRSPLQIEEIQISAAINPGNSGGPVFNHQGKLVGIATKFLEGGQNLSFGIASSEILKYQKSNRKPHSLSSARGMITQRTKKDMRRLALKELNPALNLAMESKSLSDVSSIKEVTLPFGDKSIRIAIPKIFESCTSQDQAGGSILHACFGLGNSVVFSVQRFSLGNRGTLKQMHQKRLLEPKPTSTVLSLMKDGLWSNYERKMTQAQRSSFYSAPSKAHCHFVQRKPLKDATFTKSTACRFRVDNDEEPGALSVNLWVEEGKFLYGFAVWMNDASLAEYFQKVPSLAILSARTLRTSEHLNSDQ